MYGHPVFNGGASVQFPGKREEGSGGSWVGGECVQEAKGGERDAVPPGRVKKGFAEMSPQTGGAGQKSLPGEKKGCT